jgi:hypothetical protein
VKLAIEQIRTDGGTQSRAAICATAVAAYAEAVQRGEKFPPVVVFHDGADYWLADGFHRVAAFREAGQSDVPCDVRQGTARDAILHSVGANSAHGVQRTNKDKRRAVETLLRDPEWAKWSDHEIARRASVSQPFVTKLRSSDNGYQMGGAESAEPRKAQRKGRTYAVKTPSINKRRRKGVTPALPPEAVTRKPRDASPIDEVPALQAVCFSVGRAAQAWKDLIVGWDGDKRLDMLFARERAARVHEMLASAWTAIAVLTKDCEAGGPAAKAKGQPPAQ